MIELKDLCRHKWRGILPALGIGTRYLDGKHGPCPICGGKDRFRFDDKDGRGTYFCSASDCGPGDGISLLMKKHGWTFKEMAEHVRPYAGDVQPQQRRARPERDPLIACRDLWGRGRPMQDGDRAWRYLTARGLRDFVSPELRFAPDCPLSRVPGTTSLPAMLARVVDPSGEGATIHRTYLGDGAKASIDDPRRLMPGSIPKGCAIRLRPHEGILGVAEGIETAMAVWLLFGIPCWSTINATMLQQFVWPDDIRELHVFGDHDRKFAGQAAAYQLAHRAMVAAKPVEATVHIPPTVGDDWADELISRHAHAA